ncbi:MAG: HAD family hydrolase [Gaiellaceae bacterium]
MLALVFDFNGTISDDEHVLLRVYQELFEEVGRPMTADEYLTELAGHTDPEMFTRWLGTADPELMDERIRRYQELVADGSTVDEETRAAVRDAAERRPLGLVTSAYRSEVDPVLDVTGLREAFTAIVALDDVTNGKPHPEPYLRIAELLGVSASELIVFEDTEAGVEAAKAAGAYVIALTRTLGADRLANADELVERIDVPLLERLCS